MFDGHPNLQVWLSRGVDPGGDRGTRPQYLRWGHYHECPPYLRSSSSNLQRLFIHVTSMPPAVQEMPVLLVECCMLSTTYPGYQVRFSDSQYIQFDLEI